MQKVQASRPLLNGPKHYVQVPVWLLPAAPQQQTVKLLQHITRSCSMQLAELGHGTFGMVVKALDIRTVPPSEVAIKMLPRGDFVSSHCSSSCVCHSCAHQVLTHTCHGFSCITDPKRIICHLLHLHLYDSKQSTAYPVVNASRLQVIVKEVHMCVIL